MIEINGMFFRYLITGIFVIALSCAITFCPAYAQSTQEGEIPEFLQDFMTFYGTGEFDRMFEYVHPDRGLVQNGFLLTYQQVKDDFSAIGAAKGKLDYIRVIPESGFYPGEKYFRTKCTVEYKAAGYVQQVPTVFVFEFLDDKWYLVQSEMVEFVDQYRDAEILTVGYVLPDIELETNTGRLFNSGAAAKQGRASLLYFFSMYDVFGELNLGYLLELVDLSVGRDDFYVFGVTENDRGEVDAWMDKHGFKFVMLYDDKSLVHFDLGILVHPMILLLDHEGRLVMMGSWKYDDRDQMNSEGYRTDAQKLMLARIAEVLDNSAEIED